MLRLLFFITGMGVALGARIEGKSPRAYYIEELMESGQLGRYSNNVIEDALLDVPGLVRKYGYPFEEHTVTTSDGYILGIHRIPHGRDRNNTPDPNKPVVFLMHGLFSSSADYIVLGPRNALAYILAEAGFDVWLGNTRGNYYSRRHQTLDPDGRRGNLDFWMFSWDEIGNLDLPAVIDHIIETTGQPKLHYIGHSQGCTTFFVLNSLRPEYNEKFISFQGLAPAVFFINNEEPITNFVAPYEAVLQDLMYRMGFAECLGNREFFDWFATNYCVGEDTMISKFCHFILMWSGPDYYNTTMTPLFLGHAPAGASMRSMAHFGQSINSKKFRRYNHLPIENLQKYGRPTPPEYDLSKVVAPIYLHWGYSDQQAYYKDVAYLSTLLPNVVARIGVKRRSFNHLDFVWGVDAKAQLYDRVLEILISYH